MGGRPLAQGELLGHVQRQELPGKQMAHQVAAGPAMGVRHGPFELLVGQLAERLVRTPRIALVLEKRERVGVHAAMVMAAARRGE